MTKNTSFDHSTLIAAIPDIDDALTEIATQLEQYFNAPERDVSALQVALDGSTRLSSVLKNSGLDGVAIFFDEFECVLRELGANQEQVSEAQHEVLRQALSAVREYLAALTDGAKNAALRLFPQYQQLKKMRGLETTSEVDLFCPDLVVSLPEHLLETMSDEGESANLKALRSKYQQALLRWLRQEDVSDASLQMLQALEGVMRCVPQDNGRAFWWVSCGLLDCIMQDGLPPELNARKLLGRVDQQIRTVAEGNSADVRPVLNEMLYLIARSHVVSPLVEEIKQVYALDNYLPEIQELLSDAQETLIDDIRNQLLDAKKCWERGVKGDVAACAQFFRNAELLVENSENLNQEGFYHLAKHILNFSEYVNKPEHARLVSIDLAMALLLLEDGIKNYDLLDDNFKEQSDILLGRMHAAIKLEPEDGQQLSKLVDLHFQMMGQSEVMNTLLNEMLANLQHVEQGLNAYFSSAIQRSELAGLLRLLSQIRGGLSILSLDAAAHLLLSMESGVLRFAQAQNMPEPAEKDTMVGAMAALESYLHRMASGNAEEVSQLEKMSEELVRQQHVAASAADMPSILSQKDLSMTNISSSQSSNAVPVQHMSDEDKKLIDVFLEEAQEVLGIMRANIEICKLHPDSIEPLATIRRGFHTLKGSGRMVGLVELGEVAWCVERAMNNWLQAKKPATADLLQFVNSAVQAFSGWVDALDSQGEVHIEAGELKAAAQQIEDGQLVEVTSEQVLSEPEPATPPAPEFELDGVDTSELPDMPATESDTKEELETEAEVTMELPDHEFTSETEPITESHLSSVNESDADLAPPLESTQEVVRVGEVVLSQSLFNIASTEAVHNLAILQAQLDGLGATTEPEIHHDFIRAAHTLVGLNQTMGFEAIVDLASALECWLQACEGQTFSLSIERRKMLEDTIAALGEMVSNICNQHMPGSYGGLVNQLRVDIDILTMNLPKVSDLMSDIQLKVPGTDRQLEKQVELEQSRVQDEIDEQLLPVFLEEAEELYPKISECLLELRKQPQDEKQEQSLKRLLHTLKGSSRMVGAMRIGDIAHAMEDRLSAAAKAREEGSYWDVLERNFDLANALLEELRGGEIVVMPGKIEASEPSSVKDSERGRRTSDKFGGSKKDRRAADQGVIVSGNVLRMRSELVDKLVSDAGEISVARSRIETEVHAFKDGLLELTSSVMRLRQQLREVEIQAETQMQSKVSLAGNNDGSFDPLELDRFTRLQELTRFMNESVHDVQTVRHTLLKNMEETSVVLQMQGRIIRELHQNLMNVRMVSFSSIADRLYRIVRQTGKELEKRVNLELTGMTVELDRSMLEKMVAPFEHLLRNAIVHGLENDQFRMQAGKLPIGEIRLSVRQEVNEVIFDFSDDGAGLDYVRLHEKAIASGLLSAKDEVKENELAQLIFMPGLSTATEVTESAGRGIGMDVVRSEIAALGGAIHVQSKSGLGTRFVIRIPLTLAVTQIVLARSGGTTYAIPSSMVEQVRQLKSADMASLNNERKIEWHDCIYPLHYLSQLLTDTPVAQENHLQNQVLLLRSGEECIALHVDELLGNQEVIVKNIGLQLSKLSGIAGATVLGTGVVVLILNPFQLTLRASSRSAQAGMADTSANDNILTSLPLIMVVDDSLTVRKITTRMLKRAGYQVVTAIDGVDALEQLDNFIPDVMLLDIEMPRMDGFALARELRSNSRTENLPIIMITSRTADKHREYAMQLGVNAYLGKPYQEGELLQKIAAYISEHKSE